MQSAVYFGVIQGDSRLRDLWLLSASELILSFVLQTNFNRDEKRGTRVWIRIPIAAKSAAGQQRSLAKETHCTRIGQIPTTISGTDRHPQNRHVANAFILFTMFASNICFYLFILRLHTTIDRTTRVYSVYYLVFKCRSSIQKDLKLIHLSVWAAFVKHYHRPK